MFLFLLCFSRSGLGRAGGGGRSRVVCGARRVRRPIKSNQIPGMYVYARVSETCPIEKDGDVRHTETCWVAMCQTRKDGHGKGWIDSVESAAPFRVGL